MLGCLFSQNAYMGGAGVTRKGCIFKSSMACFMLVFKVGKASWSCVRSRFACCSFNIM